MRKSVAVVVCALVACFAPLAVSGRGQCDIPSRFWCDDRATAAKCGVTLQCGIYEWKESAAPVSLGLYYESLCPFCAEFFYQQLNGTFNKVGSIMNVTIVPYGNAQETKVGGKWKFTCQHGPQECAGNLIETCTIGIVKNINKYLPFITCIEKIAENSGDPKAAAMECAALYPNIPYDEIIKCTTSDLGNKLEHEMAVLTDNLNPPHIYTPWIVINGVHTEKIQNEAQGNLLQLICDTYKGTKPAACN